MGGGNQGQVLKYSVVVVAALQATSKEMSPDVPRTKRDYNNKKQHTHTHTHTHSKLPTSGTELVPKLCS